MGRIKKIWKYNVDLEQVTCHLIRVYNAAGFSANIVVFARDEKTAVFFAPIGYPFVERDKLQFEYLAPIHHVKIPLTYVV